MLEIDFSDLSDFEDTLKGAIEASFNLSGIEEEVKQIVADSVAAQIDSQGARGGTPYAPLKQNDKGGISYYERRKIKLYGSDKVLVASGKMKDALADIGNIEVALGGDNNNEMTVRFTNGARVPAIFHQLGTKYLPARPVLVLTEEDRAKIGNVAFQKMLESFKNRLGKK